MRAIQSKWTVGKFQSKWTRPKYGRVSRAWLQAAAVAIDLTSSDGAHV
jgi:hypothetical protein